MSSPDNTCSTCKHFTEGPTARDLTKATFCRRYPPTGAILQGPNGQPVQIGFYPPTQGNHSCGEWSPRNILQVQ